MTAGAMASLERLVLTATAVGEEMNKGVLAGAKHAPAICTLQQLCYIYILIYHVSHRKTVSYVSSMYIDIEVHIVSDLLVGQACGPLEASQGRQTCVQTLQFSYLLEAAHRRKALGFKCYRPYTIGYCIVFFWPQESGQEVEKSIDLAVVTSPAAANSGLTARMSALSDASKSSHL